MEIHDEYNPYTVVQRHQSQWFMYVPNAPPMEDYDATKHGNLFGFDNGSTYLTVSHDAVNLNSIPPTDSVASLQERYVVPEIIAFSSGSEVDTRSAGNPYAHHPNYTTPSQYFGHITEPEQKKETEDVLTIMDIQKLSDPFVEETPGVKIMPPNDVTINKKALGAESLAELGHLDIQFPVKGFAGTVIQNGLSDTDTLNKKMLSPESMYELEQVMDCFNIKDESINAFVFREFSPETLADLREIRNFSQYTDFPGPSKDVQTGIGMSPTQSERFQFEWTENVAYGGI
ncbi:hypothetical protein L5515_003165 [Caenorhabditis briggsae]|uniref:Uncharacterized protein n=1 Tax=Caenorhabditis briggsae TaxID=6238 RepID=A0AAE9JAG3_CAEBR|nr:hypothetical protein L5515_003165 [Caenorhabditis briggsae]